MSDIERILGVLPQQTQKDLEKLCEVERRSLSNFVSLLIQDALDKAKAQGKIE